MAELLRDEAVSGGSLINVQRGLLGYAKVGVNPDTPRCMETGMLDYAILSELPAEWALNSNHTTIVSGKERDDLR